MGSVSSTPFWNRFTRRAFSLKSRTVTFRSTRTPLDNDLKLSNAKMPTPIGQSHSGPLALTLIVLLGLALRFWNLDLKPFWLDETITLLFSTGHHYIDIPLGTLEPLGDLLGRLSWQSQSCGAIAESIRTGSTHPPLFFCMMHQWLGALQDTGLSLRWQSRSLPAIFGVAEIWAMYWLNRVAFSPRAGLWAAGLMAVSPFAVYLSQEARHYTLPMLVMTLSMSTLVQIVQRVFSRRPQPFGLWMTWVALSSLGLYVHYFCVLTLVAQVAMLLGLAIALRRWRFLGWTVGMTGLVGLSFLPWMSVLLGHTQRSETDWLKFDGSTVLDWFGPIVRLVAGGIISVVMFPVEGQPLAIILLNGLGMLAVIIAVGRVLWRQIPKLFQHPQTRPGAIVLGSVLGLILAEYLVLIYGFRKDLTLATRYMFVFYPLICGLMAAGLTEMRHRTLRWLPWSVVVVGVLSTGFVVHDLAFVKPFQPQQVAQRFLRSSDSALIVLQTYQSSQDVAAGLSSAFAVQQFASAQVSQTVRWGFVGVQEQAVRAQSPFPRSLKLWRVSAIHQENLKPVTPELKLSVAVARERETLSCAQDGPKYSEFGIEYQAFDCQSRPPK